MTAEREELMGFNLRMPISEKVRLHEWAAEHGMTFTDFLIEAAQMYAGFDHDFMEQVRNVAGLQRVDAGTLMQQLLTYFFARDQAILDTIGGTRNVFARSFLRDAKGNLITGDEHSKRVYEMVRGEVETLLKKIKASARTGAPSKITTEEAATLALRV